MATFLLGVPETGSERRCLKLSALCCQGGELSLRGVSLRKETQILEGT